MTTTQRSFHAILVALVFSLSSGLTHATDLPVTSDLVLHLDASDPFSNGGTTLPGDGSRPAGWLDTSGNFNDTTSKTGSPTWIADGGPAWNNKPVFRFDGSSGYLIGDFVTGGDPLGLHGTATEVTILAVLNPQGNVIGNNTRWFGHSAGGTAFGHQGLSGQTHVPDGTPRGVAHNNRADSSTEFADGPASIGTLTDTHILISTHERNQRAMYDNSVAGTIDNTDWGAGVRLETDHPKGVGAYNFQGALDKFLTGDLAEVAVYSRALSDAELNQVGSHLGQKYDVAWLFEPPALGTWRVDAAGDWAVSSNWQDEQVPSGSTASNRHAAAKRKP